MILVVMLEALLTVLLTEFTLSLRGLKLRKFLEKLIRLYIHHKVDYFLSGTSSLIK